MDQGETPHDQQNKSSSSSSGIAATQFSMNNYASQSSANAVADPSNQTQEISDDAEDHISSISSLNHNSTDQRSRGHPVEIRGHDPISSGSEDMSPRPKEEVTARGRDDLQEPDIVMTQTSTSTQGQGPS